MAQKKLPKKPKKPRASASIAAWQRFDERVKQWRSKCTSIHSDRRKKESLIKKYQNGVK